MYDYLIFTHLPVFYKINLYNELSRKLRIKVIFLSTDTSETRSADFTSLDNIQFDYLFLDNGILQGRNVFKNFIMINNVLKNNKFRKIIVSGWDLIEYWYIVLKNFRVKNCLALESSIYESINHGPKGLMKKIFLSKINCVFASGNSHRRLLESLKYKGDIRVTNGVGIINKMVNINRMNEYRRKFLYIGRLIDCKNLFKLIEIFNQNPNCNLSIVGIGPLYNELKDFANCNIRFYGEIENRDIPKIFEKNNFLILPSLSETWGLVVEEAFAFGIPVIVSNKCGCSDLVIDDFNGYIIDTTLEKLKSILCEINNKDYVRLLDNINSTFIKEKNKKQILSYM